MVCATMTLGARHSSHLDGYPTEGSGLDERPHSRSRVEKDNWDRSMKVLYIGGTGRSGSTILDQILGQLDGFFAVGELSQIWERGLVSRRKCGCGVPVPDCPVWSPILGRAFGQPWTVDPSRIARLKSSRRSLSSLVLGRYMNREGDIEYHRAVESLYMAVQHETGCRVIVDSSKSPVHAKRLDSFADVDVYFVHLVRDPRATAYSWLRKRTLPDFGDDRLMLRQSPLETARRWVRWQLVAELLWRRKADRYLLLKYEDFVREPSGAVKQILRFVGDTASPLPFVGKSAVRLAPTHSVSGNPSRFKTGTVQVRDDREWEHNMQRGHRVFVTALTWPLLRKYGYSLH
jgi:Sulfotransferase family